MNEWFRIIPYLYLYKSTWCIFFPLLETRQELWVYLVMLRAFHLYSFIIHANLCFDIDDQLINKNANEMAYCMQIWCFKTQIMPLICRIYFYRKKMDTHFHELNVKYYLKIETRSRMKSNPTTIWSTESYTNIAKKWRDFLFWLKFFWPLFSQWQEFSTTFRLFFFILFRM